MSKTNLKFVYIPEIILLFIIVILIDTSALCQNYSFSVPELKMQVFVQPDSSIRLIYDITFTNSKGAQPIDIVDIGTPHNKYSIDNMSASVDGSPLNIIRPSQYVKPGVEIHLKEKSIAPGNKGVFHFEFTMPNMVYQDTTRKDYASFMITPTWFGKDFVIGKTDIWIAITMLPDVKPEEMLYQKTPFTEKVIYKNCSTAIWHFQDLLTGPHIVGISFPQRGMSKVIHISQFGLLVKWLKDNPDIRVGAGIIFIVLFSFLFFRFTGKTGCSVFAILSAGLIYLFVVNPATQILAFPALVILFILNETLLRSRHKIHYLPAIAQLECGIIKRGLTAPEAAVLLEMPLNKVLTLVFFGLLKKGVLNQIQNSPLAVAIDKSFISESPLNKNEVRLKAVTEKGIVLHKYEEPFLDVLEKKPGKPISDIDFSLPMKELIEYAVARIKGFDLKATREYYRKIIDKALNQTKAIGDIEMREKLIDRDLEWILLNDDYPIVLGHPKYHYRPTWTRPYTIGYGVATTKNAPIPTYWGKTTFEDVSASFAGWTENTMSNLASSISPGSLNIKSSQGGIINLGGFDKVTSNIFEALAESSSHGGGGGGGGCACAGCACACACAGGGR